MNIAKISLLAVCTSVVALFTACSSTKPSSRYPTASAGIAHKLEQGTVVEVREVVIDGQATNVGMAVGGAVGGAIGAVAVPIEVTQSVTVDESAGTIDMTQSSNQNISRAATGIGAAAGMVVGRHIEKKLTTKRAQEIIIDLDSGERVVIVQAGRDEPFHDEERVQVYSTRMGNSRVFHGDEDPYTDPDTSAYLIDEIDNEIDNEAAETPVSW